jgi:hypothetical protein
MSDNTTDESETRTDRDDSADGTETRSEQVPTAFGLPCPSGWVTAAPDAGTVFWEYSEDGHGTAVVNQLPADAKTEAVATLVTTGDTRMFKIDGEELWFGEVSESEALEAVKMALSRWPDGDWRSVDPTPDEDNKSETNDKNASLTEF